MSVCEPEQLWTWAAMLPLAQPSSKDASSWLIRGLLWSQGKVKLPSKQQMAAAVEAGRSWRLGFMPVNEIFAGRLQNLCQGYFDELLGDMGEQIYRKVWSRQSRLGSFHLWSMSCMRAYQSQCCSRFAIHEAKTAHEASLAACMPLSEHDSCLLRILCTLFGFAADWLADQSS